jgi:hypothetical protein
MSANVVPPQPANVVVAKKRDCKPFIIQVMVYVPESGYKVEVLIEKGCTSENKAIWKFVFDLYKKQASGDGFDQMVHVSYTGLNAQENAAIAGMVNGMTDDQIDQLPNLHNASKTFADDQTSENQTAVTTAARAVVVAGN